MKKFLLVILLFASGLLSAQKNEISMLPGITTSQYYIDQSAVFQMKYERNIAKTIDIQTGLRYHNKMERSTLGGLSNWIQSSFNSYKVDLSVLLLPINKQYFKLKAGIGFDIGFSNYYYAARGVGLDEDYIDENNNEQTGVFSYWRYDIEKIVDIGTHFIFQANYYFKNDLFVTSQILYNYLFDDDVSNPKYSHRVYRSQHMCLSAGVGFRF